jgi:hypothetical protein
MQQPINNNKQTAVEFLVSILNKEGFAPVLTEEEIHQADEMFEQQIINAFENGEDNIDSDGCHIDRNGAQQYYNETYKLVNP